MTAQEIAVAQQVFGSQLNYENVQLTNLSGAGGRAFTAPGVDGKTYCNLGSATYDNTLNLGPCPAGGSHDHTGSGNYLLQHDTPLGASQQADWKWCGKCQELTYAMPTRPSDGSYPVNGERLIHELTHAWQIQHNSFVPGFVCSGIVNQGAFING
jgi:hypothetical protein